MVKFEYFCFQIYFSMNQLMLLIFFTSLIATLECRILYFAVFLYDFPKSIIY
jgi:hypothetical protein